MRKELIETNWLRQQLWRLLMRLGAVGERWVWNDQFRRRYWHHLTLGRSRALTALIEELAGGGSIVELGCGEGALIESISPHVYKDYVGIDVSEAAIRTATQRASDRGLNRCRFEVGRMSSWTGGDGLSLIVMEECLYYINRGAQQKLLAHCLDSLAPKGSIVVTVHSAHRHRATLNVCLESCRVVREIVEGERVIWVLRRASAKAAS